MQGRLATRACADGSSGRSKARRAGTCLVCGSRDVDDVFALDEVPVVCNVPWRTQEEALRVPRRPIQLACCAVCEMVWNRLHEPDLGWHVEYENRLDFSPTFSGYAQALARRLVRKHRLRGKTVLEVGAGGGGFLARLADEGIGYGVGFEPASTPRETERPNVHIIADVFRPGRKGIDADFAVCRHVLEHVADPGSLLEGMRASLERARGRAYVEVPNAQHMFRSVSVWDVIYEHRSYFTPVSLVRSLQEAGFRVTDVGVSYERQYLWAEGEVAGGRALGGVDWRALSRVTDGIRTFGPAARSRITCAGAALEEALANGRVAVWGAGSKAVTFCNVVPRAAEIDLVVDLSPLKRHRWLTGAGREIVAPEDLPARAPTDVFVMNPIYRAEIADSLARLGIRARLSTP